MVVERLAKALQAEREELVTRKRLPVAKSDIRDHIKKIV
jgi:hypothetical protein